jgi:Flp pilus assembly secretin CpaC
MQRLVILLACLAALGPAYGTDESAVPPNIRVIVEYIEVPHELVTEVMTSDRADSGPRLHARMRTLTKEGKAKVLETSIVTSRSGQKAVSESITEYIYPTEYDPGGLGWTPPALPMDASGQPIFKIPLRPTHYPAFETRNVGVTLEIEPTVEASGKTIDLRFAPEIVQFMKLDTHMEFHDQWGDASMRYPRFTRFCTSTSITLRDGKFGFVGVLTPTKKDGGPDTTRKTMLFVRADVMTIENPDSSNP